MLNSKPRGSEGSTKYRRVPLCAITMSSSENKPISLSRKSRLQSEAVRAKRELISLVAVSRRKKHGKTSKGSLTTKNQKGNRTRTISRRMEYLNNNKEVGHLLWRWKIKVEGSFDFYKQTHFWIVEVSVQHMSEGSREIFDQTLEEWVSFKQANCLNDRKHAGAVSKHFYVIKNACTYCAVEIFSFF